MQKFNLLHLPFINTPLQPNKTVTSQNKNDVIPLNLKTRTRDNLHS